jgi:hypothetical protein
MNRFAVKISCPRDMRSGGKKAMAEKTAHALKVEEVNSRLTGRRLAMENVVVGEKCPD